MNQTNPEFEQSNTVQLMRRTSEEEQKIIRECLYKHSKNKKVTFNPLRLREASKEEGETVSLGASRMITSPSFSSLIHIQKLNYTKVQEAKKDIEYQKSMKELGIVILN